MNYADWYTDRMDIHRVKPVKDGALTRHERVQVSEDVPCRIYRSGVHDAVYRRLYGERGRQAGLRQRRGRAARG